MHRELANWLADIRWLLRPDRSKAVTTFKLLVLFIWSQFILVGLLIIFGRG